MRFNGSFTLEASDREVYECITDARRMASVIPDVQSFESVDEDNYRLTVKAGLSFIKGKFNLKIRTAEKIPNSHAEISGSGTGSGSSASFHGVCDIRSLSNSSCQLDWNVEVQIGGLAASVGSRLVQSASEKYIKQLIDAFSNALSLQKKSAAQ